MNALVPTLSLDGWLESTSARCDALLSDFIVAAYSQYPQEKIESSLPWLLVRYQGDPSGLETAVVNVLTLYFERYFRKAVVTCSVRDNPQDESKQDLHLSITVTDVDGSSFSVSRVAAAGEQRTLAVAKENNGTLPTTG